MSILQNAQFLRNAPFTNDVVSGAPQCTDQSIHVFVYNHYYDWSEFNRYFPSSNVVGTARLAGWVWHINATGQPNIRRAYTSPFTTLPASQKLVPPSPAGRVTRTPPPCTYGYIFSLPSTAEQLIHTHFSCQNTLIRALFTVDACISTTPLRMARFNAITYFDPRHTSDLRRDIVLSRAQKIKWHVGLNLLRSTGAVPKEYAQRIAAKLNGLGEVEAIWICPRAIAPRVMDLKFLAEEKVEDDLVIIDHGELSPLPPPLNISANRKPRPRPVLVPGIKMNTTQLSTSKLSSSSTNTNEITTESRTSFGPSIVAESGNKSRQSSPSPEKRANNPLAKENDDVDRPAKKLRRHRLDLVQGRDGYSKRID